jgi:hypothetical protein
MDLKDECSGKRGQRRTINVERTVELSTRFIIKLFVYIMGLERKT